MFTKPSYELFKMKPYESITEMTNRLKALLTTLRKLRKHYSKEDVNTKILRVLPKNDWESRITSIEESHDRSKLSTDILIGKLLTHELILRQREEEQQSKNKKSLGLKASQDSSDESELVEYDEEITSFIKYLIKKNLSNHKESKRRGFKKTKEVICFKCKRPGHIQDECPKLKHREAKERRRAFKAT